MIILGDHVSAGDVTEPHQYVDTDFNRHRLLPEEWIQSYGIYKATQEREKREKVIIRLS